MTRRQLVAGGALMLGACTAIPAAARRLDAASSAIPPELMQRALAARERHRARIAAHDLFAIVDFSRASREARFHVVDTLSGAATSLLVAHGRGSDPGHSGWLQRFSNAPGSAASSAGAYLTGDPYVGAHGRSRRLVGLDPTNSNAEPRAVVIHAAWYVGPEMVRDHGKLGRSEGCLAVSESDLDMVLARLGPGRLIYADKV